MLVSSVASNTGTEANAGPSPGLPHLHTEEGGDLPPPPEILKLSMVIIVVPSMLAI